MARDDPECLPSSRILRRIRWPLQPRFRDYRRRFRGRDNRRMTLSRHPGTAPILHPSSFWEVRCNPTPITLSPEAPADVFTADDCSELGPCSLASPLFLERCTKRIRDLMMPDDFCNCLRRTGTHRSSHFLAGTEAATSFLFFYGSRCIPYETGEPRRAAHSSSDFRDPGVGSSHFRGFAQPRCPETRATFVRLAPPEV